MWQTQFTQSLNSDATLASGYNYVVEIPSVPQGDLFMRLALRGPASGQSRVTSMFIGHGGTSPGFDGSQVPVTVNGSPTFTLGAGALVYSDPILASDFGFDVTKKVILAYGLTGGDKYRRNTAAGSGFVLYYKTGTGDAGNTSKTGYTTSAGATAILEGLQFAEEVPATPPPLINESEGFMQVLNGERHSSGGQVDGESGKHLTVQFKNPSNSGKLGLLYEVEICPEVDTIMTLRSVSSTLGVAVFPKCNLRFGAGQGLMEVRYSNEASILGNFHSIHMLKGGVRNVINLDAPLVGIEPGSYVIAVLHSSDVGAVVNFQWRELVAP
jgi:hypothetical protein